MLIDKSFTLYYDSMFIFIVDKRFNCSNNLLCISPESTNNIYNGLYKYEIDWDLEKYDLYKGRLKITGVDDV